MSSTRIERNSDGSYRAYLQGDLFCTGSILECALRIGFDYGEISKADNSPAPWTYDEKSNVVYHKNACDSSDQCDICYINMEVGDKDGFPDGSIAHANGMLIASAPIMAQRIIDLEDDIAELKTSLNDLKASEEGHISSERLREEYIQKCHEEIKGLKNKLNLALNLLKISDTPPELYDHMIANGVGE